MKSPDRCGDEQTNFEHDHIEALEKEISSLQAEIGKINNIASTGTADNFLKLSDEDKKKHFALSLIESSKRKALEAELERYKWIDVSERLPEIGSDDVLVINNGRARIAMNCDNEYFYTPNADKLNKVTHWMPIPPITKG